MTHAITFLMRNRRFLFAGLLAIGTNCWADDATKPASLTGCVDEQPGPRYVLMGDRQLRLLAHLKPDGFAAESFAKYLGHKVVVTGQLTNEGDPPVMSVKAIKRVADSCVPAGSNPQGAPVKLSGVKTQTGCIDEQPGSRYVLRGDRELRLLLELEPENFPVESFAKHLGQKVQVRGRTYSIDQRTIMRVSEVKTISKACLPQSPPPKK